jgi:DNA invertase Pin-like site-specific DNA recombinase
MSTEMQQYSMENQQAAIRDYAERRGFEVVKTYRDAGKSGLVLRYRNGLSSLLKDVVEGQSPYKAVLVYDVSRWGRFQDCDEAAHYEFLCRNSGAPVHYCAEPFENDGTLSHSILKALKRSMAAEYSRELGTKCFDGQKRLAELGFRMGASPGYGLRRMLISEDRRPKQRLDSGEYKSIARDRVILVPGPKRETDVVKQIYAMALHQQMRCREIAVSLNQRRIPTNTGKAWNYHAVHEVLTNWKYTGWNVWGRTAGKLNRPQRPTSVDQWIKKPGAFVAIVGQFTFDAVQKVLQKRSQEKEPYTDRELLAKARRLLRRRVG